MRTVTFRESLDNYNQPICLIVSEDRLVGEIRYAKTSETTIEILNIRIYEEYRRQGYGTLAIAYLRDMHRGKIFYGDILYPGAFAFWSSLKDRFDFMGSVDYYDENLCPCLTFEFK